MTLPAPFLLAFVALMALAAGAGVAIAWAELRRERQPRETLEAAIAQLRVERARDRLDMAEDLAKFEQIGETVKRHRARIDGAEGARQKREAADDEAPPAAAAAPRNLHEVMQRARARGML